MCERCGAILVRARTGLQKRFCSATCRSQAAYRRKDVRTLGTCARCGGTFKCRYWKAPKFCPGCRGVPARPGCERCVAPRDSAHRWCATCRRRELEAREHERLRVSATVVPVQISERWLPVVGWERLYEVSDCGRVRRRNAPRGLVAAVLKPHTDSRGRLQILLCAKARRFHAMVHRLVAEAFTGPMPMDRPDINHLNGIYTDNRPENLEWCKNDANMRHAAAHGLTRGSRHYPKWITFDGQRRTVVEWSALLGINYETLRKRFADGWPVERALVA